jgi:O-antigen ligase
MLLNSLPPSRRLLAARSCAVAALCMVPVSTALTNIFCALFAVALITAPGFGGSLSSLLRHGASLAALLLVAMLALSVAYSVASPHTAWEVVAKYDKLLLLPLGVIAFRESGWAPIVRRSLFATLLIILVFSTTNYLGLTAIGPAHATVLPLSRAWVFKNHIAAGMFDALLFYQAADLALAASNKRMRVLFAVIAAWTLVNVFVMLQGRTGQIIAVLMLVVVTVRFVLLERTRSPLRAGIAAALSLMAAAALIGAACTMHGGRLASVGSEVSAYERTDAVTSTGLRVLWYKRALDLLRERPIAGYGAGGLEVEFAKLSEGKTGARGMVTANPHNEYLLMAVQLGTIGVLLFINLLVQIGRGARRLDPRSRHLLLAWLGTFAIGSLANSLLLDFAEGHLLVLLAGLLLGCAPLANREPAPVQTATAHH